MGTFSIWVSARVGEAEATPAFRPWQGPKATAVHVIGAAYNFRRMTIQWSKAVCKTVGQEMESPRHTEAAAEASPASLPIDTGGSRGGEILRCGVTIQVEVGRWSEVR